MIRKRKPLAYRSYKLLHQTNMNKAYLSVCLIGLAFCFLWACKKDESSDPLPPSYSCSSQKYKVNGLVKNEPYTVDPSILSKTITSSKYSHLNWNDSSKVILAFESRLSYPLDTANFTRDSNYRSLDISFTVEVDTSLVSQQNNGNQYFSDPEEFKKVFIPGRRKYNFDRGEISGRVVIIYHRPHDKSYYRTDYFAGENPNSNSKFTVVSQCSQTTADGKHIEVVHMQFDAYLTNYNGSDTIRILNGDATGRFEDWRF